jgi:uncharacterized membrane protein YqjE
MLFRNPAGHAGLRQNIASFLASLTQFLQTRVQLATRDSKAAARHLVTALVCGIAALVLSLLGFIYLIVFAIVGVAHLLGVSWIWVALVVALIHFGIAVLCIVIALGALKRPMFRETATVLKEDTEWLKNLDQKKHP